MYPDRTEYRWAADARAEKPKTYNAIFVWQRATESQREGTNNQPSVK
jgi:hypothetical protein